MKIVFEQYPEFTPNLTPVEVFKLGAFGGTYFRPIFCSVTKKYYENEHLKYPEFKQIPEKLLTSSVYDKTVNYYNVSCGTSLEYWQQKGWIKEYDPYGWFQWYCNFYYGRRCPDDARQINRWRRLAGINGRFSKLPELKKNKQN